MMQTTTIAMTILSVLNAGILLLVPRLDKRLYRSYPKLPMRFYTYAAFTSYNKPKGLRSENIGKRNLSSKVRQSNLSDIAP